MVKMHFWGFFHRDIFEQIMLEKNEQNRVRLVEISQLKSKIADLVDDIRQSDKIRKNYEQNIDDYRRLKSNFAKLESDEKLYNSMKEYM